MLQSRMLKEVIEYTNRTLGTIRHYEATEKPPLIYELAWQ